MKFITTQTELNRAISIASRAVNTRQIMPTLKSLLLEVKGTKLSIYGTDLNVSIKAEMDISGNEDGRTLVDSKLLGNVVRALPNSLVSVSTGRGTLNINALTSDFDLATLNDEDFPDFTDVAPCVTQFSIKTDSFMRLVYGTSFAASVDEKKGVLMGCLLDASEDSVKMVALDGFRLALATEKVDASGTHKEIISAKDLVSVASILKETDSAEVDVQLSENFVKFSVEGITIVSRLLSGQYVNYTQIMPKSYNTRIVFNQADLVSALDRASILSKEGKNNLVRFNIGADGLNITSRGQEGRVNEKVAIEMDGADLVIGFNAKYLLDALKAVQSNDADIAMEFTSAQTAALIKPVDGDEAFTYLVLPVRLKDGE